MREVDLDGLDSGAEERQRYYRARLKETEDRLAAARAAWADQEAKVGARMARLNRTERRRLQCLLDRTHRSFLALERRLEGNRQKCLRFIECGATDGEDDLFADLLSDIVAGAE
ncbi:hypothetical protein [Caenispirillum bisanense]|uniref:hypothetical protein n=1 Tax=Caenispirillum bisanense TaxID=414052 RepID=UPI0031E24286